MTPRDYRPFYMRNMRNRTAWIEMVTRFNHRCVHCFKRLGWRKLTVDHVVPLYIGGADDISNIQPLCNPCNVRKFRSSTDYRIDFEERFAKR